MRELDRHVRIACWNVNSVRARFQHLRRWLCEEDSDIDVCLLQELKTNDDPALIEQVGEFGYQMAMHGQKARNGVAILSRIGIEDVRLGLPGDDTDLQSRYIEAVVGGRYRVASIYLPNGNPVDSDSFRYKLDWMDRLVDHAEGLLELEERLVLGGDYNVIPTEEDCADPAGFRDDAAYRLEVREKWRVLVGLGYRDAVRARNVGPGMYSHWDYQRGAWDRDEGVRIDHLLLSPQAADRLTASGIDRRPRGWSRPSDHCPVWCELLDGE